MQQPTIGRIVLHRNDGNSLSPAIITDINHGEGKIVVTVFGPTGTYAGVKLPIEPKGGEDDPEPNNWFWPVIKK